MTQENGRTKNPWLPPPESKWSRAEKAVARRAFEWALERELKRTIGQAKQMARAIQGSAELWDLEAFLTKRRREIDQAFEWRTSVLIRVLGNLIREGKLTEKQLEGLSQEKMDLIRRETKS